MSTQNKLGLLLSSLDDNSRYITMYLLNERHAGIRELTDLICASSDMDVLMKIREIINPQAQLVMGKPIATFQRSKIDLLTGEKIMFSWWVDEELASSAHTDVLVDVLDEEDLLRVVATLPSKEQNITLELTDSFLIISGQNYYQEIPLLCPVNASIEKTIRNGVLEVKLTKKAKLQCL